jgi:hypothetical protein
LNDNIDRTELKICNQIRNDQESLFLRLPSELRNQIYQYVYRGFVVYSKMCGGCGPNRNAQRFRSLFHTTSCYIKDFDNPYSKQCCFPWSLTFLSRKLYTETRLLPYQMSTFRAANDDTWIGYLSSSLGPVLFGAISAFRFKRIWLPIIYRGSSGPVQCSLWEHNVLESAAMS